MSHVFVSYVRENQDMVTRLCNTLRANGVEVWLDRDSIAPGKRWKREIRHAIEKGAFFVACFSKEYSLKTKTYMNEELTIAIQELRMRTADRTWFIPLRLSDCSIPDIDIGAGENLRDIQWLDLWKDWDGGIKKLLEMLRVSNAEDAPKRKLPTKDLQKAFDQLEYLDFMKKKMIEYDRFMSYTVRQHRQNKVDASIARLQSLKGGEEDEATQAAASQDQVIVSEYFVELAVVNWLEKEFPYLAVGGPGPYGGFAWSEEGGATLLVDIKYFPGEVLIRQVQAAFKQSIERFDEAYGRSDFGFDNIFVFLVCESDKTADSVEKKLVSWVEQLGRYLTDAAVAVLSRDGVLHVRDPLGVLARLK